MSETQHEEKNIGELADEQLAKLTQLEELLSDLENGREIYRYQVEDGAEAVEELQDNAIEILRRFEDTVGPI
jgi:protein-tyrosine phosphatase